MKIAPVRVLQIMGIVESGGVEAVIMNYYRHIDKSKVQFDFVMHKGSNPGYIAEAKGMGAKVYEITPYTKNIIKFTYEIYKIIKEGNYQIVHSNMNSLSGFPLMAAYFAGANVRILHNHTMDSSTEGLRTFAKRVLRPFAKAFANKYWACSKLAGEWMYGKTAVKNGKVTIIHNAIDLDRFAFNKEKRDKLRRELDLEGKFVVGHVGRFVKVKNHEFLIDAFEEVVLQKENAVLLLIGDGPLMGVIKEKVNNLGLTDKVIFLGVRSDVADLYNVMDVFVFPSLYEGLGLAALEAQKNGLPVIASTEVPTEVKVNEDVVFLDLYNSCQWGFEISSNQRKWHYSDFDVRFDIKLASKKVRNMYLCMK